MSQPWARYSKAVMFEDHIAGHLAAHDAHVAVEAELPPSCDQAVGGWHGNSPAGSGPAKNEKRIAVDGPSVTARIEDQRPADDMVHERLDVVVGQGVGRVPLIDSDAGDQVGRSWSGWRRGVRVRPWPETYPVDVGRRG